MSTFYEYAKNHQKLDAIKLLRHNVPSLGLKQAKDVVELIMDSMTKITPPRCVVSGDEIIALLKADRKIPAIKLFRQGIDIGLKEAKYMVDTLEMMTLHNDVYCIVRNLAYCKPHDPVAIGNARERLLKAFDEQFPIIPRKRVFVYHGPRLTKRYSFYVSKPEDINFERIIKELTDGSKMVVVTTEYAQNYMGAAVMVNDSAAIPRFLWELGYHGGLFGFPQVSAFDETYSGKDYYRFTGDTGNAIRNWRGLGINVSHFEKLQSALK